MAETIALVTGANKGLGKEISRQLGAKKILVLMGARDRQRGEKAVADLRGEGLNAEFIQLDVTSRQLHGPGGKQNHDNHGRDIRSGR
jgi:NAD(P)-dependent dehydrogenase (short-subunit alcohol dehydrogenase family)